MVSISDSIEEIAKAFEENLSFSPSASSGGTLNKLSDYINAEIGGGGDFDDAGSVISSILEQSMFENNKENDEFDSLNTPKSKKDVKVKMNETNSVGTRKTDRSLKSSRSDGKKKSSKMPIMTSILKKMDSSSQCTTSDFEEEEETFATDQDSNASSDIGMDMNLDAMAEKLAKKTASAEPVKFQPKRWEYKVQGLAKLVDKEKEKSHKLDEIQDLLKEKKAQLKTSNEKIRYESKVKELEWMLEDKRNQKSEKLRELAKILQELRMEKREMKKLHSERKKQHAMRQKAKQQQAVQASTTTSSNGNNKNSKPLKNPSSFDSPVTLPRSNRESKSKSTRVNKKNPDFSNW